MMRITFERVRLRRTLRSVAFALALGACTEAHQEKDPDASSDFHTGDGAMDLAGNERHVDGSPSLLDDARLDAGVSDAATDGGALFVDPNAPHNDKKYRRVLILGDSFVGLGDGLATALRPKFEAEGTDVRTVPWKAIKIIFFADDERVPELLKKWDPDLVLLVLGGNDMFVPEPEKHAYFVRKTAKLMKRRDCYWLGPPPWKKSTGILDVIARDSTPCTFFDARGLDIERKKDHIHPTNVGGEVWANAFWKFFRG